MKKFLVTAICVLSLFNINKVNAQDMNTEDIAYKTYPLPGGFDKTLFFNSNSPEMVTSEGVLLSTFSPENKKYPEAHLNRTFQGRFDIFTHHITPKIGFSTLYQGIIMQNTSDKDVELKVLASTTYLTREAPFKQLDDFVRNDYGEVYAGPGDRISQDIIRNNNLKIFERNSIIKIKPFETIVFMNMPLLGGNERSAQFSLDSDGPLYIADLASYDKGFLWIAGGPPKLDDWINILENSKLAEKRDLVPTPVDKVLAQGERFIYSRVSGVAMGSTWNAEITNNNDKFVIPDEDGRAYVLNTMHKNTLGTNQIQTKPMEQRYPDTAYYSNGNYGVTYNINIPFYNDSNHSKEVKLSFDTPIRLPEGKPQEKLSYYKDTSERVFFRGEIKVEYKNYFGMNKEKYFHIVQHSGQKGQELLSLALDQGEMRNVKISYVYPADSTAPHVLSMSFSREK